MNPHAQKLGRLSAKKRKTMGHDSAYYSLLAQRRWDKEKDLSRCCGASIIREGQNYGLCSDCKEHAE